MPYSERFSTNPVSLLVLVPRMDSFLVDHLALAIIVFVRLHSRLCWRAQVVTAFKINCNNNYVLFFL